MKAVGEGGTVHAACVRSTMIVLFPAAGAAGIANMVLALAVAVDCMDMSVLRNHADRNLDAAVVAVVQVLHRP